MNGKAVIYGLALAAVAIFGIAAGIGREIGEYLVFIYLLD